MGTPKNIGTKVSTLESRLQSMTILLGNLQAFVKDDKHGLVAKLKHMEDMFQKVEKFDYSTLVQDVARLTERVSELETSLEHSQSLLELTGDLHQRKEHKVGILSCQLEDVQHLNMANTLIMSGLAEIPNETFVESPRVFAEMCEQKLKISEALPGISAVYRVGVEMQWKICGKMYTMPRIMIVQCTPVLRQKVMKQKAQLAKNTPPGELQVFINQQMPMSMKVHQDKLRQKVQEIQDKNKSLPEKDQIHYKFVGDKLLINNTLHQESVTKPEPQDVLFPDDDEFDAQAAVKFAKSMTIKDRGSQFVASAMNVHTLEEVRLAYRCMMQGNAAAHHVVCAYHLHDGNKIQQVTSAALGEQIWRMWQFLWCTTMEVCIWANHASITSEWLWLQHWMG